MNLKNAKVYKRILVALSFIVIAAASFGFLKHEYKKFQSPEIEICAILYPTDF